MMSVASSGNGRNQTKKDMLNSKAPVKCRIPQRQSPRPKSIGSLGRTTAPFTPLWTNKPDRLMQNSTGKQTFATTKRMGGQNKQSRYNTFIPRTNNANGRSNFLPKQARKLLNRFEKLFHCWEATLSPMNIGYIKEALKKEEELEVQEGQFSYDNFEPLRNEVNPEIKESVTSVRGKLVKLKICWQEQIDRFDNLKTDLGKRQADIMKLYASICKTHKELLASGQTSVHPPDELSIMNVAKLTPEQLLQMCADADKDPVTLVQTPHTDSLEVNKFYDLSSKLVDTCKEALEKRKGIIEWFDKLMKLGYHSKAININKLDEKVKEFNAENESLRQCLEDVRLEFYNEMKVIVKYFRKAVNDAVNDAIYNQRHAEDLTCQLSELNAQNLDLKKTLHSLEHTRKNKLRFEELEKNLFDEKRKKTTFKERADIAETQLREKEQALEKLNEHCAGLEQTIQELNDQNHQLQENFDKELNKLMDSITENTANLKEIAIAREKLQAEKENIEKRYKDQTDQYMEEIKKLKKELTNEVEKRVETDAKYLEMLEKKKLLEPIVENMQKKLKETDKLYIDALNTIKFQEEEIKAMKEKQERLELLKRYEIEEVNKDIDNYKSVIEKQNSTIQRLQQTEKEIIKQLDDAKKNLGSKEQYITSLEIKQTFLEDQLKQSELKMSSYEEQLSKIKNDINSIQDAWGYFENIDELKEMLSQQRFKLDEATDQISLLRDELHKKDGDLKAMKEKIKMQEYELNEKTGTVEALAAKDEEHRNVIKLMKENFEMRIQADAMLHRELAAKKDAEISTVKDQVERLKNLVYTLKDQAAKQKHNDKEVITMLERTLADVDSENRQSISNPKNFDSLLQLLEEELQSPYKNEDRTNESRRSTKRRVNREKRNRYETYCHEESPSSLFETEQGPKATKIVMGNFVKKTYIAKNEDDDDVSDDLNLKRKGGTKLETQRWLPIHGTGIGAYEPSLLKKNRNETYNGIVNLDELKEKYLSRNLQFMIPSLLQEEKQSRMFRFAKHRM